MGLGRTFVRKMTYSNHVSADVKDCSCLASTLFSLATVGDTSKTAELLWQIWTGLRHKTSAHKDVN